MKEIAYKEFLAKRFSDLNFILKKGTFEEKPAVLALISMMAAKIEQRRGQKAPEITSEQITRISKKPEVHSFVVENNGMSPTLVPGNKIYYQYIRAVEQAEIVVVIHNLKPLAGRYLGKVIKVDAEGGE